MFNFVHQIALPGFIMYVSNVTYIHMCCYPHAYHQTTEHEIHVRSYTHIIGECS